ncbi:MAG: hypothetical protein FWE50_04765 [Alphaproteobacteria bacterium]|nr:hypothetical protein [Alphaproteobacteria bacterium]
MNQTIKKISIFTSALAVIAVMAGCSSTSENRTQNEDYVQTHQNDEVTRLGAKMFQAGDRKTELGNIRFNEREGGLEMRVRLRDVRPSTNFMVRAYDLTSCPMDPNAAPAKTSSAVLLPDVKSNSEGIVNSTFLIPRVTAAELAETKIVVIRRNADGTETKVAHGILREKSWF